jgi:hypothetical protein
MAPRKLTRLAGRYLSRMCHDNWARINGAIISAM